MNFNDDIFKDFLQKLSKNNHQITLAEFIAFDEIFVNGIDEFMEWYLEEKDENLENFLEKIKTRIALLNEAKNETYRLMIAKVLKSTCFKENEEFKLESARIVSDSPSSNHATLTGTLICTDTLCTLDDGYPIALKIARMINDTINLEHARNIAIFASKKQDCPEYVLKGCEILYHCPTFMHANYVYRVLTGTAYGPYGNASDDTKLIEASLINEVTNPVYAKIIYQTLAVNELCEEKRTIVIKALVKTLKDLEIKTKDEKVKKLGEKNKRG